MTFEEILVPLREFKKVRRTSWHTPWSKLQEYMWYDPPKYGGSPILRRIFGRPDLRGEDLEANDWEVYT